MVLLSAKRGRRRLALLMALACVVVFLARLILGPDSIHWSLIAALGLGAILNWLV